MSCSHQRRYFDTSSPEAVVMNIASSHPTRESSISVAVRVRPFTNSEESKLIKQEEDPFFVSDGSLSSNNKSSERSGLKLTSVFNPRGIRKIVNVVDDKMLIFDPPETNPLSTMQNNAFPNNAQRPRIREYRFVFDKLFDVLTSQQEVYNNTTRPLLDSILDGYNATVFAYGATGCGKTHTILGSPQDPGVIFLTMKELFEKIEELSDEKLFDVSLSFLEIYNETIRDLLNPETSFKKLILREDAKKKISVANLSSHKPKSVEEVMDLILLGNQNRTSSPTEANATSSRSHAVLQINVVQKNRTADINEEHTFATLSIIDLAGSERAAATKNRGARLNEGANINKSLLALGNCINALCDPRRRNHIPYRDSKLTRLLKFSLGGNCKTVMIVCISPSSQHYDETLNTLKYADRAKEIKTKLIRNQHNLDRHVGSYLKMITEQKQEINELRTRENKVIESTINKQNQILGKCNQSILDSIDSIKKSLDNHQQDKWKKYFLLAKRKLLLSQQTNISLLSENLQRIGHFAFLKDLINFPSLVFQVNQLTNKINQQIVNLEKQYGTPSDIDNIFTHSIIYTLKKLKESEGWTQSHTFIFENLVDALKDTFEKDIMINSSILFDYLLSEIKQYVSLPKAFLDLLIISTNPDQDYALENIVSVVDHLILTLESMNNSDFDVAIEKCTSTFIQQQFNEVDQHNNEDPYQGLKTNNLNNQMNSLSPNQNSLEDTQIPRPSLAKSKRGSTSPLKSSPPRNLKKATMKKLSPPKISPVNKLGKKVRWDVSDNNIDTSMIESEHDISMEEPPPLQQEKPNNTYPSSNDDNSPINNDVLDRSDIMDDLDFKFDPSLDSPSVNSLLKHKDSTDFSRNKLKYSNPRLQSLTNRKLPTSEESLDNEDSLLKLPLLNKGASTKIISEKENEHFGFSPGLLPSPTNNYKSSVLSEPSRVINNDFREYNHGTRNIGSNGSEEVE